MSYTYLQGQGAESSAATFSDIPASVLSRLNLTAGRYCSSGSVTDACPSSPCGTMFVPSTGDRGGDSLTLCVADSPVRTFRQQDAAAASPASGLDSGRKWPASLAKYDPDSCSWRTHQFSLRGDLELFSETWPRWGLMRGGECWERTMPDLTTSESESGLLPTPRASMGTHGICWKRAANGEHRHNLEDKLAEMHIQAGGAVISGGLAHPSFVEWMMDWPDGWTDLQPLGMARFQAWQHSHGGRSAYEQAKSGGGQ